MRALHAAFLCGVAFLVGRQSTLAPVENPVECWRPRSSSAARRLLTFNGGKRHGKGRGGKRRGGNGHNGKLGKRGRSTPTVTLDDEEEQRRQERGAMGSGAAGRCVNDEQAASFFRAHKGEFLYCAGDERRVIAALALLSPDGNKVIVDVPAQVETMLALEPVRFRLHPGRLGRLAKAGPGVGGGATPKDQETMGIPPRALASARGPFGAINLR